MSVRRLFRDRRPGNWAWRSALALTSLLVHGGEAKADELFARFLLCLEQTVIEK